MLLLLGLELLANAAEKQSVDFQSLCQEIQKTRKEPGSMTMLMWFPIQFWEASLAGDARLTGEQKKGVIDAFRPYTTIAVVDGKFGEFGVVTYKSESEIRDNIQLVDAKGNAYSAVGEDDVQPGTKVLLGAMKPVMGNILGPMGKNLHVFLFPALDSKGQPIANAKSKGFFVVKLNKEEYRWKLPLGSLLPAKQCPKCKEQCSGAWDFCPWCGTKLGSGK
jgi:hypothetical protein